MAKRVVYNGGTNSDKPEYLAISSTIPVVGNSVQGYLSDHSVSSIKKELETELVINVEKVGNTVFKAETKNSIYFVKVQ